MSVQSLKLLVISLGVFLVLGVGLFVYLSLRPVPVEVVVEAPVVVEEVVTGPTQAVIGSSVSGREITAYTYGTGTTSLLFVGGIHGGYEWNSVLLAYEMMDHLEANPELIPENLAITIVPSANPDGLFEVTAKEGRFIATDVLAGLPTGTGRFNANEVDLNRNFDCKWAPESSWRGATVSAGTAAFSEPEAVAIRDLVSTINPEAVVFWHSAAGAVYASECEEGVLPETLDVMNTYATAAGYKAVPVFDAYPITGDVEGWLASIGIPAVTVEFTTHTSIEWQKNLAGVEALFTQYGK